MDFNFYAQLYKKELYENVIPFWLNHSIDKEYGGFFTCLDQFGKVYDTDKFIWLQGRQIWCFSFLYPIIKNENLKLEAIKAAQFLDKHGKDNQGNFYFSLNRAGKPLIQPYNIFSDCFATLAFATLYKIDNNEKWKNLALQTYQNILKRQDNWKGIYNKSIPESRSLRNFSLPMILCNLQLELVDILGKESLLKNIPTLINTVLHDFYNKDFNLILENINKDGSFSDSFEGRLLNPGHAIESTWFIMDLAEITKDKNTQIKAVDILLTTLEYGWDKEFGGIYYFMDVLNKPLDKLEWNQKLWWVHIETLVALIKGYYYTKNENCLLWFEKVHNYTWQHFKDPEYGEWFGYLNRDGSNLNTLKGGKWKGCFHLPRGLFHIYSTIEKIVKK